MQESSKRFDTTAFFARQVFSTENDRCPLYSWIMATPLIQVVYQRRRSLDLRQFSVRYIALDLLMGVKSIFIILLAMLTGLGVASPFQNPPTHHTRQTIHGSNFFTRLIFARSVSWSTRFYFEMRSGFVSRCSCRSSTCWPFCGHGTISYRRLRLEILASGRQIHLMYFCKDSLSMSLVFF